MSLTKKEIESQFEALKKTIDEIKHGKAQIQKLFAEQPPQRIVSIGCGSSYELACGIRNIAFETLGIPSAAYAAGDVWMHADQYKDSFKGAWVICISRSGLTTEVLRAGQALIDMRIGVRLISIICANDTPLEKLSSFTVRIPWAYDNSVCQTRSVTNMFAAGAMLVECLAGKDILEKQFEQLALIGNDLIAKAEPVAKEIAALDWCRAVVLSDGPANGLAGECALAFKEISQQEGYCHHLLDVRHGPMVLIHANTLVLAWIPNAHGIPEQIHALLNDIIEKGARLVVVTEFEEAIPGACCISIGQETGPISGILALALMCQLVAYEKSLHVGCNPDQPDGLPAWIELK